MLPSSPHSLLPRTESPWLRWILSARVGFPPGRVDSPTSPFPVKPHSCCKAGGSPVYTSYFSGWFPPLGTSDYPVRPHSNLLLPSSLSEKGLTSSVAKCSLAKVMCCVFRESAVQQTPSSYSLHLHFFAIVVFQLKISYSLINFPSSWYTKLSPSLLHLWKYFTICL